MTTREFHRSFNAELDKMPAITGYPAFLPQEVDRFINSAIRIFVKNRYSGKNFFQSGFQQSEKRDNDLRSSIATYSVPYTNMETSIDVIRPVDFWLTVGEDITISSHDDSWPYTINQTTGEKIYKQIVVDPLECTIENFTRTKCDSLSDYRLHNSTARPLRVDYGPSIHLETDGNYFFTNYMMYYIKSPDIVDFRIPNIEYTYIPEIAHDEIVALAVKLALENVSEPRLETQSAVQTGNE